MKGEYKTKSRNAIVEYLKENADKRFTARDIIEALDGDSVSIDRSTIYRNLDRLCQEGQLVKYTESDIKGTCYQYSSEYESCNSHMHAQCTVCGKIYHLDNKVFAGANKKMKAEYGISIDFGKTVIMAVCEKCKNS